MFFSSILHANNPQQVPHPHHHMSSNILWKTIPFQMDSFFTLTPDSALRATAWICLPLQFSFKILCQASPPYILTVLSPCLDSDALHWVIPIQRCSDPTSLKFGHLHQTPHLHGCSPYPGWSLTPEQVNPPKWMPSPHLLGSDTVLWPIVVTSFPSVETSLVLPHVKALGLQKDKRKKKKLVRGNIAFLNS